MKSELKQFPLLPIYYSAIPGMQRTIVIRNEEDYKKLYKFFKNGKSYAVRLPLPQSKLYSPGANELFVEHTVEQMDPSNGTVQVYAMPLYQSANLLPDSNLMLGYELEPYETNVLLSESFMKAFDEIAQNLVLFNPIPPYEEVEGIHPNTIYNFRMLSTLNSYYDPRKLSLIEEILEFIYERDDIRKVHYFFKAVIRLDGRIRERYIHGLRSAGYTQEANQNKSIAKVNLLYFNPVSYSEAVLDLLRNKKYEKFNHLFNAVRLPDAVSCFVNYSLLAFITQGENDKFLSLFLQMARKLSYLTPPSSIDYSKVPKDPSKLAIKNAHFEEVNAFLFSFAVEGITYQMMLDAIIPAAMGFRNVTSVTQDLKNEESIAFSKFFASADNLAETLLLHFGVYTAIITLPMANDEIIEAEMHILFSRDKLLYEIASTIQSGYEDIYRTNGCKEARLFAADSIGNLLGYPQCCIEQYQKVIELTDSGYSQYYQHFGSMIMGMDIASYKDFYSSMFTVGFIPCSDKCAHATSLGELLRSQYIGMGKTFHLAANTLFKHIKIIFRENIQDLNRQSELFHKVLDDHSDMFVFDNSIPDYDLRQYHWQYRRWDINAFFTKMKLMFETAQEPGSEFHFSTHSEEKYAPLDEIEFTTEDLPSPDDLERFRNTILLDLNKPHRDIGEGRDYDRLIFHDKQDYERFREDDDPFAEFDDENGNSEGDEGGDRGRADFFDFTDDDEDDEPDFFRDMLRRFGKEPNDDDSEDAEEKIISDEETRLSDYFIKLDDETSTPKRKPKKDDSEPNDENTINEIFSDVDSSDDEDEEDDDDEDNDADDEDDDETEEEENR